MKSISQLKEDLKRAKQDSLDRAKSQQDVIGIWEQDKRVKIPNRAKKFFCIGCRNNYYNGCGASECWSLDKARLCRRKIYQSLDSRVPEEVVTLNCFVKEYRR
jgi:hypothetical protein